MVLLNDNIITYFIVIGTVPVQQQTQQSQQQGQAFTGTQGTWTGNNTLTYTQSMQPPTPDVRSAHAGYCKYHHGLFLYHLVLYWIVSFISIDLTITQVLYNIAL
jgi:hypothetical protein